MILKFWKSACFSLCVCLASISALGHTLVAQTGNVVISTNTTYPTGTYNLTSLTVENGATLTIGGGSTVTVSGAVLVTANSNIVLQSISNATQVNGTWQGAGVTLNAGSVEVDAGSSINADGQGYVANAGPGGAAGGSSAGGSYGGVGGTGAGVAAGAIYGTAATPTDLGSGGGSRCCGAIAGTGGGAVRIVVSGTLTDNGVISANGANLVGYQGGGGAGGSVYVTTAGLAGSGVFTANGGTGGEAAGGGGRIAVYFNATGSSFTGFSASTANGGSCQTQCSNGTASAGSTGTSAFFDTSATNSNLSVYQNFTIPAGTTQNLNAITVQTGAALTIGGGSTITVASAVTVSGTLVAQSINNSAQVGGSWQGSGVTLHAASVVVNANGSINADGQGYTAGAGPGGAPSGSSAGGSYGGLGGVGDGVSPGPVYGSTTSPTDLGSGGNTRCCNTIPGAGGGALTITVSGTLTDNGIISANGGNGAGLQVGGGSGGTVFIQTGTLTGSGSVSADGGLGGEAGGGGGRVAIYYNTNSGFDTTMVRSNGGASSSGSPGAVGTVYTLGAGSNLIVSDNTTLPANANFTFNSVTVNNAATLTVGSGTTLASNSVTVSAGSTFNVGGGSTLNISGEVLVTGDSAIVLQSINNAAQVNGTWLGQGVTLNAGSVQVDAGSSINADGQGYLASAGPGGAPGGTSAGGSYGGIGGSGDGPTPAGPIYGSDTMPTDLGSGGGSRCCGAIAGLGGGAIRIIVSGTLTDNGVISANGGNLVGYQGGGGSGGSVWVTTAVLAGSGVFTANGGTGGEAAGGGGRIAVYYNAPTSSFTGFSTSTSNGGSCQTQCANGTSSAGAVGTAAFFDTSSANDNLMVDQDLTIPAGTTVSYNSITVQPGALLTIGGGSTVTVANSLTVSGTVVAQSINNSALVNNTWQGSGVVLNAASVVVNMGGSINADGQGYAASAGPGGAPAGTSAGGSYGGLGGLGDGNASPGGVYGSAIVPTDLGSGGSTRCCGTIPGAGGGALTFNVSGSFTNNGVVSANGGPVVGYQAGGGSGGSVYVRTGALYGSGAFTANGGVGGEAGGGGGRVAIYYDAPSSTYTGFAASTATGGACGANGNSNCSNTTTSVGGNGTAAFFDTSVTNNNLAIYQNFTIPAGTTPTYNSVTVQPGSQLTIGGGATLTVANALTVSGTVVAQSTNNTATVNDVWAGPGVAINAGSITVNANGSLNADTQGYVAGAGPGGAPAGTSAGGSYGGLGGVGNGASPSPTYGSLMLPVDLGSGGGTRCCGTIPGAGGGALGLTVSGTLTDNGVISANGGDGTGLQVGGGSGGSVSIHTATLAGSGSIAANGGAGGEAGGGGGRVALYFNTNSLNLTLATASGGTSDGGNPGAVGTVYIPGPVASTTALSVTPAQLSVGQTATFQAIVSAAPLAPAVPGPTPTGTVNFLDGTTVIATQPLSASQDGTAIAQFQTTALAVGTHSITASYSGSGSVLTSTSAAQTVSVAQATSTTSFGVSAANITAAQSETLTATVAGLTSPVITGNITFFDGTTSLGTVNLTVATGTGTATLTVPSLAVGPHNITAHYNGDTNYTASSSAPQTVTVSQITSATRLAVSAASIGAGQSETLTATIAGAASPALSGVVTFFDGTTSIGTGNVTATSTGGTATLTTPYLAIGTRSLTAHYGGDTNYTASVSAAQTVTVSGTPQTITFPAIPNHVYGDAPFALTATASSGLAVSYSVVSGPATVSGSTVTLTGIGTVTIQATQAGNTTYAAATPVSQSFLVTALVPTLASIAPTIGIVGSGATTVTLTGTNFASTDTVLLNGTAIPSTLVSATSLTATLPASFFAAAGTGLITVADSASETVTVAATFTVAPAPQFVLTGPSTATSGEQPMLTFTLTNPYPFPLAGALNLAFVPVSSAGVTDDPTVQFATGGRMIDFNIPANSTATPAVQLQTGTIAGTATVTLAVASAGVNVTPANVAPVVITVPAAVPALDSVKLSNDGQTLSVSIVGYSNTREVTKAVFHFTAAPGSSIQNPDVTVDVSTVFAAWYGSGQSDGYGSAFTYTQPFTIDSDASSIAGVTVTLENSVGVSVVVTAQ